MDNISILFGLIPASWLPYMAYAYLAVQIATVLDEWLPKPTTASSPLYTKIRQFISLLDNITLLAALKKLTPTPVVTDPVPNPTPTSPQK